MLKGESRLAAEWGYDSLLFVLQDGLEELRLGEVGNSTTDAFCRELMQRVCAATWAPAVKGVVVPLEIRVSRFHRQDLVGVDVLEWLRWYGYPGTVPAVVDALQRAPVLAFAAQPLEAVLRQRPNLLLTSPGTEFAQVPDPPRLQRFVGAARLGTMPRAAHPGESGALGTSFRKILQRTHHDLANEGFAAQRLVDGYRALLRELNTDLATRIEGRLSQRCAGLSWYVDTSARASSPSFNQYESLLARYQAPPHLAFSEGDLNHRGQRALRTLLSIHLSAGTARDGSLLLVDDDHARGAADAVELIVNSSVDSTARVTAAVYATATTADAERCLSELGAGRVVVLLDLRLNAGDATSPPTRWESVEWLRALHEQSPTIPVIVFSATRSLAVYQAVTDAHPFAQWVHKPFPGDGSSERSAAADFAWKILGTLAAGGALARLKPAQVEQYLTARANSGWPEVTARLHRASMEFAELAVAATQAQGVRDADAPDTFLFPERSSFRTKNWYRKYADGLEDDLLLRRRLIVSAYAACVRCDSSGRLRLDRDLYQRAYTSAIGGVRRGYEVYASQLFNPSDAGFRRVVSDPAEGILAAWLLPEEAQSLLAIAGRPDLLEGEIARAIRALLVPSWATEEVP